MSERVIREQLIALDALMGREGADSITGFKGKLVAYTVHITGCDQVYLLPQVGSDGKKAEGAWFDFPRIDWNMDKSPLTVPKGDKPGASEATTSGRRV